MARRYPPEFRRRVLDLIASGRKVADVARSAWTEAPCGRRQLLRGSQGRIGRVRGVDGPPVPGSPSPQPKTSPISA